MLIVLTGNGKGKTTSALGTAFRAVGDGRRALMVQFIKGPWKSGEDEAVKRLEPDLAIVKTGKGFVGILGDTIPLEEHRKAARDGLEYARAQVEAGIWDMLILDEVHNAITLQLLSVGEVIEFVDWAEPRLENLILTGRDAHESFIKKADIVTEMKEVKHIFNEGTKAKKGLDY